MMTKQYKTVICRPASSCRTATQMHFRVVESYEKYIKDIFYEIDNICPHYLYMFVRETNKERVLMECKKRFNYISIEETSCYKHKKNIAYIIKCGRLNSPPNPKKQNLGDIAYTRWVCKNISGTIYGLGSSSIIDAIDKYAGMNSVLFY